MPYSESALKLSQASMETLLAELTPERREQYYRVRAMREKFGLVNFNVAEEIRKSRGHSFAAQDA